jgi:hypothetical protein
MWPPPLIEGEDAQTYQDLFNRLVQVVAPTDIIESIHVCDAADYSWAASRLPD